jgi:protein subunit release factor B
MTRTKMLTVTIKDCTVQTFRAGGKGGQNQNKRDSGVRVIHPPSGARGESREGRSQLENKRKAFVRMAESPKFKAWVRFRHAQITGAIEAAVEESMRPENLLIDTFDPEERKAENSNPSA